MSEGIYKRGKSDKKWSIVINVGTDPKTGKRKQKWYSFTGTKRQAEAERVRLLGLRNTGALVIDPTTATVEEYLQHWLRTYVASNCRPLTHRDYSYQMKHFIISLLGSKRLAKLTQAEVREAYATLLAEGAPGGKPVAANSMMTIHAVFHRALTHAVKWGMIGRNPAEGIDLPRARRRDMTVWSVEDVRRFLNTVEGIQQPYGAFLSLAIMTGMRPSEIIALRWQDADLERGFLQIVQSIQRFNRTTVISEPKTASGRRRVALTPMAVALLKRQKASQNADRLRAGPAFQDSGLVFTNALGEPVKIEQARALFKQAIKAAGLPDIRLYDTRHTHASLLLHENVHPKIVSERLGHSNISVTLNVYSHLLPGLQDAAASKLDQLLQGDSAHSADEALAKG